MSELSNEAMQVQLNIAQPQAPGKFSSIVKITDVFLFPKYLPIIHLF